MIETLYEIAKNIETTFDIKNPLEQFSKDEIWRNSSIEAANHLIEPSTEKSGLTPRLPTDGAWTGEKGNSVWIPDLDKVPNNLQNNTNPENLTWREILQKYGIEGIEYKDGYPDFSPFTQGEVEIDNFTENRQLNFAQAEEKLANQWTAEGRNDKVWTARDVQRYRKENNYVWHECEDCKTLQLIPKDVHEAPHTGGIAVLNSQR